MTRSRLSSRSRTCWRRTRPLTPPGEGIPSGRGSDRRLRLTEVERRAQAGTLTKLAGIGPSTSQVVLEALAGETPAYLIKVQGELKPLDIGDGQPLLDALKGDLHTHSDWSDGGSPIDVMARAMAGLGHEYTALTDHSPRLTVANGLSAERLQEQLSIIDQINEEMAPFRLLKGIEVDINEDGSLDQEPEMLEQLDVVVASVHSKLRMESGQMTERMMRAIANPFVDVFGHCTGSSSPWTRDASRVGVRSSAGVRGVPILRRGG